MALIDNLISYYKLDEVAGDVIDAHGDNDGTNVGATPNVAGKINTSYDFDGSNDYIQISDYDFTPYEALAFGMQNDAGTYNLYVYYKGGWSAGFDIGFNPVNAWHMYTLVIDGTNNKVIFYVDGSSIGEYAEVGTENATYNFWARPDTTVLTNHNRFFNRDSAIDFKIGAYAVGTTCWPGKLDEPGIWEEALSPTEITALWNGGAGLAYPFVVGTNMKINISDIWKDINSLKINIGDVWKDVIKIQQNIGDVWKDVFG